MTYALDTNIISYYLQYNPKITAKLEQAIADGNAITITPIVHYEIINASFNLF